MSAENVVLPDGDEMLRRLEAQNESGVFTMFLPCVPKLAAKRYTAQALVMELTLAVATYARDDRDATWAGFMAAPLVIDALVDDEQVRDEVKARLRAALKS